MYLHLGVDCMVKNSEIIAIFNLGHPQSRPAAKAIIAAY